MYKEDRNKLGEKSRKCRKRVAKLLSKRLGPEYISYRPGWNGGKIAYVEGWTIMSLANKIFGYDGWFSEIKSTTVDFYEDLSQKINIGISVVVRITLKDGTFKEDLGFGSSENQKNKSTAWEKAKKEAVTDAIKRAFRQFGNALGNCCYDKEFLRDIQQVGRKKSYGIDKENLMRKNDVSISSEMSTEVLSIDAKDINFTDEE